jgi:hypothetical protein
MNEEIPRAALNSDGTFGPHSRLRCACCGAPSLDSDTIVDGDPLSERAVILTPVCRLCEWENRAPTAIDKAMDDSISLAEAQANYDRFCWMYNPDEPRPWMQSLPSNQELAARRSLRQLYRKIDREEEGYGFDGLWDEARDAEANVERLVQARERALDVDTSLSDEEVDPFEI